MARNGRLRIFPRHPVSSDSVRSPQGHRDQSAEQAPIAQARAAAATTEPTSTLQASTDGRPIVSGRIGERDGAETAANQHWSRCLFDHSRQAAR